MEKYIEQRTISNVWEAEVNVNSPIHKNRWLLEPGNWEQYDPFLLLAEDWFQKGSFALHPHRGIETFTYVIDGTLEHQDNKAGEGVLHAGDAQLMTAGKGVIHLEDPVPGQTVHSLQLWINLPKKDKMTKPRYQNLPRDEMPVRQERGATARVFSGSSAGVRASTKNYVPLTIVEITVEQGASIVQDLPSTYNGFIFVVSGEGIFGDNEIVGKEGQILWLGKGEKGDTSEVKVQASSNLKVMLYAGEPLKEPVVARGPFVMNSEEEIIQAYNDFRTGKFVD